MAYTRTNWVDNVTPLSAANLNKIEAGIVDALLHANFKQMFSGTDGDKIVSSNENLETKLNLFDNLTINEGVTCKVTGITIIGIKGTLTLHGTLSATGGGAPAQTASTGGGGGIGGAGGGALIIFANEIIGAGTIEANGDNGGDGIAVYTARNDGANGYPGKFYDVNVPGGNNRGVSQTAPVSTTLLSILTEQFPLLTKFPNNLESVGAGGGASGGTQNTNVYDSVNGAGGGYGIYAKGGRGAVTVGNYSSSDSNYNASSGGGGGGGGMIMIMSLSPIPAGVSLSCKGGKGGNGHSAVDSHWYAGRGGGGGGGVLYIFAPASLATINVSGGAKGITAGIPVTDADAGDAGYARYIQI